MKKLIPLFALAAVCLQSCAYKTFSHGSDYSMKIPKSFQDKTINKENGTYQDLFYGMPNGQITDYVITVVKAPNMGIYKVSTQDSNFLHGFTEKCNCSVSKAIDTKYSGVTYAEIDFTTDKDGIAMKGISLSAMFGTTLYSVDLISRESSFEKEKPAFLKMMRSFKVK